MRLSKTTRTTESLEEYPKLPKSKRDFIKDKRGFIADQLRDNRRKRETVASRSMLTLDADHATTDLINSFEVTCANAACLYTTDGHTPKVPRARIIVPMIWDVTSDEYSAIARYFTDSLGIDQFDECSYLPHQLIY